nr:ribonuclease H [Tanacetum cinerariifolium]
MQTQTSNNLLNAIMEAGGKDRLPMLAPGNYVHWKSRIKRYIDTKPNHELIHYCLKNPPYKFTWADKVVPVSEGSPEITTETYMENYKNVSQDIRDQLNAEAKAVQIILIGIDNDIYSTVDACPNACEMWKAIERLKHGESINIQDLETNLYWEFRKFTSRDDESLESYYSRFYKMMNELVRNQCDSQELKTISYHKLYDILKQHQNEVNELRAKRLAQPSMVAKDDKMSKDKEIDKLMALISLSFKKIYKPTNNNLRTSSNTSRANQDNSLRINRGTRYESQRIGNVAGTRETVEQADWRDDTDDESEDQELEAHYMYMAQIQEVSPDAADDSGPIFDSEPLQKRRNDLKKFQAELDRRNDVEYASKVEIDCANPKGDLISYKMESQKSSPEYDEVIHLEKESRSKLSDLIRPFDYEKLNNLYDLFVQECEKSYEQRYFLERSRMSHTPVNNGNLKESFNKQTTLLEKRMDESIPYDQKCKSSKELFKTKRSVGTIIDGVERCKETNAKRIYFGHIDPFIQNTIEANFCLEIQRINADLEKFHVCLKEEMVADLRYFNSLELEVDSLKSQLETQKTQFLNKIDRLSREYYYANHMNAILGVYIELDEVTNLQCDYLEMLEKCECLEKQLSKSKMVSKGFEALQKHAINLEIYLQQCQEKIKNDKSFKENQSKEFRKEREQYFEIQDLKAQLQDKGIVISELKKLIEKLKGKSVDTKFEKSSVIRQSNAFKSQRPSISGKQIIFTDSLERKDFSKSNKFEMSMMGELKFFLGIQIHQSPRGIFINQAKYAQEILIKHEAEYVSLSACCAQVLWMRTQLTDYGFHFDKIPMYCDSKAAIAISCNLVQHSRTKHIDVRYHFIKEKVEKGIIELFFVGTEYQLADLFTKALPEERFKYLFRRLGMRCLTPEELEVLANEYA